MTKALFAAALLISATAWSQTQINVRYQTKNIDFGNASATRPVQVGTALPGTCTTGALFFKSDAPAGANLYGCTATNTWSVLSAGSGSSGGGPLFCTDTGSVNTYACDPGVGSYSAGLAILLQAAATNTGSATLNLSGLGAKPLYKNHNQNLSPADILAGQVFFAVYDGSAFQLQGGAEASGGSSNAAQVSSALACNASSTDGTTYACSVSGISGYSAPLMLLFVPNLASGNSPTLNVNGLGPIPVLQSDSNGITAGELTAQIPYLLNFDGTSFRLSGEQLEDDGSGTMVLNRSTVPHTIGLAPGVVGQLAGSNTWTGSNDFSGGYLILPQSAVSSLPAASSNPGEVFIVTDGSAASDCTAGGGSTAVLCRSNGTAYVALSGGSGSGGGFSVKSINLSNSEILCPSSSTVLASVTIPGGTLSVGDIIDVEASDWAPNGDVTYATQIAFGNGLAPNGGYGLLGWGQKGHNYHYRYIVVGSSNILTTGSASGGATATWNASYDYVGNATSPISNDITISLQTQAGSCSGNTENIEYNFLTAKVEQ
jgi:hypothetical protein